MNAPRNPDSHAREILRGASIALPLKLGAAGLSFAFNLILSRQLGAHDAGLYFLALAPATVAAVLSRLGMDNALLRHISAAVAHEDWPSARAYFRFGMRLAAGMSALATAIMVTASPWMAERWFSEHQLAWPLIVMALSILPLALSQLLGQALRAIKHIAASQMVLNLGVPLIGLMLLAPLAARYGTAGAIAAYVLASCATLAMGYGLWRHLTPPGDSTVSNVAMQTVMNSSRPLFVVSGLQLFIGWTATFLLGAFSSADQVGLYNVAQRTAALISFVLIAVNSISAPKFAALSGPGDRDALSRSARTANRLAALAAAPPALLMMILPGWVMSLFGGEFRDGAAALVILAIGQYSSVATGSVGNLLMMCGLEKQLRNMLTFSVSVNVLLCLWLAPIMGAQGAAIATAAALILQNVLAAFVVWKRLGFMSVPFLPACQNPRSC